ncbi:MAG: hypothetical protein IKE24_06760 [Clostridia bacterium]|nr:hypothetical protein [Clostridia bacterium]
MNAGNAAEIYAEVLANLYVTAYGENPLSEVPGIWKAQLAEESDDIRKRCGGGITDAQQLDEVCISDDGNDPDADRLRRGSRGTGKAENGKRLERG